jgi:hypothetical protein
MRHAMKNFRYLCALIATLAVALFLPGRAARGADLFTTIFKAANGLINPVGVIYNSGTWYFITNGHYNDCGALYKAVKKNGIFQVTLLKQFQEPKCNPQQISINDFNPLVLGLTITFSAGGANGGGGTWAATLASLGAVPPSARSDSFVSAPAGAFLDGHVFAPPTSSSYAGTIYATGQTGGKAGFGAIYETTLSNTGTLSSIKQIFAFAGGNGGEYPYAPAIGPDGALYGVANAGGSGNCGLVWRVARKTGSTLWVEKVLHAFKSAGSGDGCGALGSVTFDSKGNLYATTNAGGANFLGGTVFMLTPTATGPWKEYLLYKFTGGTDGGGPAAGVTLDSVGNVYGTTKTGGLQETNCAAPFGSNPGCGVVFKLYKPASVTTIPWRESVLYLFTGGTDGMLPAGAPVALGGKGTVFGTTLNGGDASCSTGNKGLGYGPGCGTVFELTPQ